MTARLAALALAAAAVAALSPAVAAAAPWYEPQVIFNQGAKTNHGTVPGAAGMSLHVYCLADQASSTPADPLQDVACRQAWEKLPSDDAEEQATRYADALLLSEFGASDDLNQIERVVRLA